MTDKEQINADGILAAETHLNAQLNYGGIERDLTNNRLVLNYHPGGLPEEVVQMRRLASAFTSLAAALEDKGIACSERLPAQDDADANGNVEWLRSGVWLRGPVSEDAPVDATRWRCMGGRG